VKVFLAGRIAVEAEGVVIDERHFPGRQGRLLFAYLVVAHGGPVPRAELADALWGDAPPATWDKALSVLVSKLRGLLEESGVDGASALTAAFGCYHLDLPEGTWVDVLAAEGAANEAEGFLATDEPERAMSAAELAESVTRGPFLPGDDGLWVEEKRRHLAEVRVRALSALAEASLRTQKPAEAVRWAALAVAAEPFRESGYRRLMEAHAAAGNRGEALRVYERCRRLLAEELGAYPSPETESIYRSLLEASPGVAAAKGGDTGPPPGTVAAASRRKRPVFGAAVLLVLVAGVAAATAIAVVATRGDRSRASSGAKPERVALVLPGSPPWSDDPSSDQYQYALNNARTEDAVDTQTFHVDPKKPLSGRLRRSIGNFDLVLLAGQFVGAAFMHEFRRDPDTRFVVVDPDPVNGSLYHAVSHNPNTSDVFFVEGPGARLAGFLGGLMARRTAGRRPVVVSEILVNKNVSENVKGTFKWGATDAVHGIKVRADYAGKFAPPSVCERLANRQIDDGSRVVYADAGACSAGALDAAKARGVWVIAGDQDPSRPDGGPQIIGYTVKNFRQEVDYAIRSFVAHNLPRRHHIDIGIERGAVDFFPNPGLVPRRIRDQLARYRQAHLNCWTTKLPQGIECP
jgi:DNA-binding SARP family transcriptional activator/basic membrane lipoprotein Med (substrate-binding protein (PBP1-ABC) superfamily)